MTDQAAAKKQKLDERAKSWEAFKRVKTDDGKTKAKCDLCGRVIFNSTENKITHRQVTSFHFF